MKKEWQNNSSIYLSNNSKAYRYCLYPVLVLLILLVIFLFFGEIEVVVRGNAKVIGEEMMLQTVNDEEITHNYLKESKKVKKGDVLVKYNDEKYVAEKKKVDKKVSAIKEEEEALNLLKLSLEKNTTNFVKPDKYGYYNKFSEYQSDLNNYEKRIGLIQSNEAIKSANQADIVSEIDALITKKTAYLNELDRLKQAIARDDTSFDTTYSDLTTKFEWIKETLNQSKKEEQKRQKSSSMAEIDTEIKQLASEIDTLTLSKVQNMSKDIKQEDPNLLKEEEKKLKETNLAQVKTRLNELSQNKEDVFSEQETLKTVSDTFEMKAPRDGVIHLKEGVDVSATQISKGTTIATLFASDGDKIEIESMIPANEINKVKVGEKIKIELDQKGVSKEVYKGEISEISQTSKLTEKGMVYGIKGTLNNGNKAVKYGEIGSMSIIVGKKSYLNYLKDILFAN